MKKIKVEKWHDITKRVVLNASSQDGIIPASIFQDSFVRIINSTSIGYVDIELGVRMKALGHSEISWDASLPNHSCLECSIKKGGTPKQPFHLPAAHPQPTPAK